MKIILLVGWLITFVTSELTAQDSRQPSPVFDVSHSHSVETLKQSGLKYWLDTSRLGERRTFFLDKQTFTLRLPGGMEVHQQIEHGSVATLDREVLAFVVAGSVLPLDEAVLIARKFHAAFRMPLDRLEAWRRQALERPLDAEIFTNNAPNIYPGIGIAIRHTGNPLYPWHVCFSGGWTAPWHEGWNEERAARENPAPPKGMERLSLNAPSGRIYKSEDAYVELAREQKEHDKKMGLVRDANGHLTPPDPKGKPADPLKAPPPSEGKAFLWIGIAALLAAVALILKRKTRKPH